MVEMMEGKLLSPVDNCIYTCNTCSSKPDHCPPVVVCFVSALTAVLEQ